MAKRLSKKKKGRIVEIEEEGSVGIITKPIDKVIEEFMLEYGLYSLENRAIPCGEDGLMPVQRRSIWAAKRLGLTPNHAYTKHARLIGDVIGLFHPHGDQSVWGANVRLATGTPAPLIDGSGGWGDYNTGAAAMRYHECRLSKLANDTLLDGYYLRAVDYTPNYNGEEKEPVVLPAKLPLILAIEQQGMAVGTTTNIPAFTIESLRKVTKAMLSGKTINAKYLFKTLEFASTWGGKVVSEKKDIINFYKTGQGPIEWECDYAIDGNVLTVTGIPPGFNHDNRLTKIGKMEGIASAFDQADKKNAVRMVITLKKMDEEARNKVFEKVMKELSVRITYRINVIRRKINKKTIPHSVKSELVSLSIIELLEDWLEWRLEYLEKKALKKEDQILGEEHSKLKLMTIAIDNLDIIFKLLRKEKENLDTKLAKALKVSLEDAKTILEFAVRRLGRMSHDTVNKRLKEIIHRRKTIRKEMKNLGAAALSRSDL